MTLPHLEQLEHDSDSLLQIVECFEDARILVVGDVMLDDFVYGKAERISPEAPIPVLHIERSERMLGGAGNVVRNIMALGAKASLAGVIGTDATGEAIIALLRKEPAIQPLLLRDAKRKSTLKTRFIAGNQQLLRADDEDNRPIEEESVIQLLAEVEKVIAQHQVLILSDYAKGVLTAPVIKGLIGLAKTHQVPVLVDPKHWDLELYRSATLLSPNEKEMQMLNRGAFANEKDMVDKAAGWCRDYDISYILATRGAKGMMLVNAEGLQCRIAANAREVFDVSGAGDTAIATLALGLASHASMKEAAQLANHAAGIAVGRLGTAVVYRTDIKAAVHTSHIMTGRNKILSRQAAAETVTDWKKRGLKVGFTNGCFDIVHAGHIASISSCKAHCDRLVMAINSDASVRRLKGDSRPVNKEMDRAMLLAALSDVDMVVIFREDTPEALLQELRPDVLMKGADYQKEQIVGWEFVESYGGSIVRIPLVDGYSTTKTIERMRG